MFMEIEKFFYGEDGIHFIPEIVIRTIIMFLIILVFLRLIGKRGVKQLSVFELVVIIGLGSAAGDPMIYKEIGVITTLTAFAIILICYKILTNLVFRYKPMEHLVEGKPITIIKDGLFEINNFKKETLSKDEFFMELRLKGIYHLGQVSCAILEISGEISVYYFDDEEIKYGLPILPEYETKIVYKPSAGEFYSCLFCGFTLNFLEETSCHCPRCKKNEWLLSSNIKRK